MARCGLSSWAARPGLAGRSEGAWSHTEAIVEAERRGVSALPSASSRLSDILTRRPAGCASGHINLPLATGTSALPRAVPDTGSRWCSDGNRSSWMV